METIKRQNRQLRMLVCLVGTLGGELLILWASVETVEAMVPLVSHVVLAALGAFLVGYIVRATEE